MPDLQGIKKKAGKGKRKSANNQDFAKKKVKLGRKLEKTTETSTTFKAKRLSIAKQSVTSDRGGQEVNSRGLTLHELLVQTAHYAPNTRKESIVGLKDFFELHPSLLPIHAGAVFDKVSHFVTEQDANVRKEFKGFMAMVLGCDEPASLRPFLPMYLVHVCGGMSHIHESIRHAAMSLLDDLVPSHPAIAASSAAQIIPLYIHLLSEGETLAASGGGGNRRASGGGGGIQGPRLRTSSVQARMKILTSMGALLSATLDGSRGGGGVEDGPRSSRLTNLAPAVQWTPREEGGRVCIGVYRKPLMTAQTVVAHDSTDEEWLDEAADQLFPLLSQAWGECSPSIVENRTSLDCMLLILATARMLVRAVKWTPRAAALNRSFTSCFPFTPETVPISAGARPSDLAELCQGVCDVACSGLETAAEGMMMSDRDHATRAALLAFVEASLRRAAEAGVDAKQGKEGGNRRASAPAGGELLPQGGGESSSGRRASDGGSGFKAPKGGGGRGAGVMDAAASLVPNLSVLLRTGELGNEVHAALEAVTACLESAPAGTRLASACLGFVKEQLVDWPVAAPAQCQRWIAYLPKFLYSLSDKDPGLTVKVLGLISSLAQRCTAFPQSQRDIEALQPMLVPFFRACIRKGDKLTFRPGPFCRLTEECQAASVSLLHYVSPISEGLLSATAAVCSMDGVPTSVVDKAMDIIGLLGDSGRQAPAEVVSFIVTVGMLAQGDDEGERGSLIAGMCSDQLRRRHFKSSLPQLLGPLLTRLLGDSGCKARGQLRCLVHMSEHCLGSLSDADISNAVVALIDAGGGHQGDANVCAEVLSLVPGALVKVAAEVRLRAEAGGTGGDALAVALADMMRSKAIENMSVDDVVMTVLVDEVDKATRAGESGGLSIAASQKLAGAASVLSKIREETRKPQTS